METIPWLMISVGIVLLVFLAIFIFIKRKYKTPTDYYSLFVIGLIWTLIGVPSLFTKEYSLNSLFYLGVVFLVIGLANKSKWKQNRRTWNDLTEPEKKLKKSIIIILGILVLAGLVVYFITAN